jgi:hypothetical protein
MEPSASVEESPEQRPRLKREIGLWMAMALVIGNMVGSGIFLLPASLARRAFGDFIGFQTAWGYWIAAWAGNAALAVALVGYIAVFWPHLDSDNLLAALVGIAIIWFLTAVNSIGVKQGAQVQLVSAASQGHLCLTEPELFERRLFVRDTLIAALAFVYSVWAITGSGKDVIAKGFVLLLAAIPVYVLVKAWEKRHTAVEPLAPVAPAIGSGARRRRPAPRSRMGVPH